MKERADRAARLIHARLGLAYEVGIVLGSGLGGLASSVADAVRIPYARASRLPRFERLLAWQRSRRRPRRRRAGHRPLRPRALLRGRRCERDAHADRDAEGARLRHAHPHQRRRVAAHRGWPRRDHADHRPHRLFRPQPADRRADRRPLRRHDRSLRRRAPRGAPRRGRTGRRGARDRRLHVVLRPLVRDAGRDPHGAPPRRRRRRHVDGAGGHPRPLLRPPLRRHLGHHQFRRRHDRRRDLPRGDQDAGADRRRQARARHPPRTCGDGFASRADAAAGDHPQEARRRALAADEIAFMVRGPHRRHGERGSGRRLRHGGLLPRHDPRRGAWR